MPSRRRLVITGALVAAVVLAALIVLLAGGDDTSTEAEATPTPAAARATATPDKNASGCEAVSAPKPKSRRKLAKPTLKLAAGKTYVARVLTSCGQFEIRLDTRRAPKTTASFVALARRGFFDDTTFHRIVPGFVIQGGDPRGTGTGGPGYKVVEAPPPSLRYTRGVVAMAKAGTEAAGTSGSQFFVVTGEDVGLPPEYALLGRVGKGAPVVDTLGTVATDPATERPLEPVVIKSIKIVEK